MKKGQIHANHYTGMREPTEQEKKRIRELWKSELEQGYSPNGGKLIRVIGLILLGIGLVTLVVNKDIFHMLLLFLAGGCLLAISRVGVRSSAVSKARITAVENGDYLVVPAVSTKVDSSYRGNRPVGFVKAALSSGEKLNGLYRIPYICAEPLLKQRIHEVPVLLILFSCDKEILAIPVQD